MMSYLDTIKKYTSQSLLFIAVLIVYLVSYKYSVNHIFEIILPPKGSDPYIYDLMSDLALKDFWLRSFKVYFLSPVYLYYFTFLKLFLTNTIDFFKIVILINHLLFFISGIFFYKLTSHYSQNKIVLNISYLIYALNPISIFFATTPTKDTIAVSLFTIFLYLIIKKGDNKYFIALSGLISGVILGMRGNFSMVILITTIYLFLKNKKFLFPALYTLFCIICILPFTIRNYIFSGEFIPIYSGSGIHFYIGNNEKATGVYTKIEGVRKNALGHFFDSKKLAEKKMGRKLSYREVNEFYKSQGLNFIKTNPGKFIKLFAKKILYFISFKEISNNYNFNFFKIYYNNFKILKYTFINFGILFIFGFTGLILFNYYNKYYFIGIFIALVFMNLLIFITGRYRFIIFPILHLGVFNFLINLNKIRVKHIVSLIILGYFTFFPKLPFDNIENAKLKANYSMREYVLYLRNKENLKLYKDEQVKYLKIYINEF